jgi:N-acetylglutamate synthase-like GNAT family acetyltransferase
MPYDDRVPERSVHPAVAADYQHYARLFAELGVDDPILEPSRWEATHMPGTTLVREDGQVVAWGYAQALESVGYVRHVAVDPARRGAGLGRVLMEAIAARHVEAGG